MSGPLKLRAMDDEDLGVVSAFLQDAIVPLAEMEFVPGEKRFALVASRFRWENCPETAATWPWMVGSGTTMFVVLGAAITLRKPCRPVPPLSNTSPAFPANEPTAPSRR